MKTLTDHLVQYARYHRDRRNIATHFVGIPMIVVAVTVLLNRPAFDVSGVPVTLAMVVAALSALFYLRLDLALGALMTALLVGSLALARMTDSLPTAPWAALGVGLFVVGWVFQFVGHFWEGRKPAFVDDLMGLLVGPLFVVTEAGVALGLGKSLEATITEAAGPVRDGALKAPLS